jgi:hypothetical protein
MSSLIPSGHKPKSGEARKGNRVREDKGTKKSAE